MCATCAVAYGYQVTIASADGTVSNTFVYEDPGTTKLPVRVLGCCNWHTTESAD